MVRRNTRKRDKDFHSPYFPFPTEWFDTPEFRRLSPMAKNVFMSAAIQYRGNNNGDMALPLSYLKRWMCTGNRQRNEALAELVNDGWLIRTRHGGLRMGPDLFALSVKPIDECIDKKTGKSKLEEVRPGSGLLHLWRPERASLREAMRPQPRSDAKTAKSIARIVDRRCATAATESPTPHVNAHASAAHHTGNEVRA